MLRLPSIILALGLFSVLGSSSPAAELVSGAVLPIWPGVAPGSEKWPQKEVEYRGLDGKVMIRNVVTPTLTAFVPEPGKATGAAVIVCPGGRFRFLCWDAEGTEVAEWLQKRGITAFVLKYRLRPTPAAESEFSGDTLSFMWTLFKFKDRDPTSKIARKLAQDLSADGAAGIADGRQAVAFVRQSAEEWGLKPDRIGLMGFSAGAMVTNAAAMSDVPHERPDFAAPIYGPVFGDVRVPRGAPPLFILCAANDSFAEASSVRLYSAWREAGREAELHIFESGGHGFGMTQKGLPIDGWIDRLGDWLGQRGYIQPDP